MSSHMPTQITKIDIYICSKSVADFCEGGNKAFLLLTTGEWIQSSLYKDLYFKIVKFGAGSKLIELTKTITSNTLL